jgi:hypothetical protein
MSNSTVTVRPSTPALSAADKAAHASASYVRPWLSPAGAEALRRAEAATLRWQRDQYDAALIERGLAEYEQWAQDVAA